MTLSINLSIRIAVTDTPRSVVGPLSINVRDKIYVSDFQSVIYVHQYINILPFVTESFLLFLNVDTVAVAEEAVLMSFFHSSFVVPLQDVACLRGESIRISKPNAPHNGMTQTSKVQNLGLSLFTRRNYDST